MMLFDSHAHLSSEQLLPMEKGVMERARLAGVNQVVNICTDRKSLEEGIKLAQTYPAVVNAGATTPHDVEKDGEIDFPIFEAAGERGELVAIGETGLDYHYEHSDRAVQKKFLVRYLELAERLKLPVIFHCRDAFDDLFAIVDPKCKAVLHCFTGTMKEAEEVWKRGWYLSLSGIVTYKKSEALREVAREAPLGQLLIETDAPYLAPQTKRGKVNEPAFIGETAACIALVKGIRVEEVAKATTENGRKVFQLSN